MTKKLSALFIAFSITIMPALADEGMWLLPLIEKFNSKKLTELGFKLTPKEIYNINSSSLKDAVVHFGGGCTGEIISGEGLLLTNHHCGYGAIQKLSSVEHDYLQNGYWAMTREQELPAQGLTVTFLESFTDVTDQVNAALVGKTDRAEISATIKKTTEEIAAKAIAGNKFLNAKVVPVYGGNAYYLVVNKTYTDIRFVGAPPSSIGKFGADTDNWMWPRHTGDFSMFRVYAGKDNNPADYSKDNVPYKPKKFFTISLKGIKQNDFAMVMGYPGRTSRFMTSYEVKETSEISNAVSILARGVRQDVLMKDMLADPKVRLQYASKYAGSSNFWKKAIGMNETFKKLKVMERRAQEEKNFTEWVNKDASRVEKYGKALENIKSAVEGRASAQYLYKYLTETLLNIEVTAVASHYADAVSSYMKGDIEAGNAKAKAVEARVKNFFVNYSPSTDKKVAKAMLKLFKEKVSSDKLPSVYAKIDKDFNGDIDAFVDDMYNKTVFASYESIQTALKEDPKKLMTDPALYAGVNFNQMLPSLMSELSKWGAIYSEGQKAYIAGLLEMRKGNPIYPDANSTMRMTYGKVLNYSPKDAVLFDYITTLDGVMEKEDPNNWEFVVPEKLKELYNKKDFGQYALPNGKMPLAFITNNDITGGNSGSPVINANGELIGTAFDGNWEAMSGDIIFEPNLQRCINVDIRYTLFIMEKFGGAGHLLKEMKIVK